MNPSKGDIEYAEHQVEEARRRLDEVRERIVTEYEVVRFEKKLDSGEKVDEFVIDKNILDDFEKDEGIKLRGMDLEDEGELHEVEDTKVEIDHDLVGSHIQNIIIDCQLCIELSAKSLFKLVGRDYPFSHGVEFSSHETQGFYHEIPDEFSTKDDVPRVIFLTQFWGQFYELAKYGAPQLNVRPEMIFKANDGLRAVEDAEFCIGVAEEMLEQVL
jgi:HEPN domain-containing protein